MTMFELRVPFFIPLWRRILTVAVCFGWAGFELMTGAVFWAILFGAFGVTALWQFFLSGWPDASDGARGDS